MKCKSCEGDMYIGPSGFKSSLVTTEVTLVQSFYCPSVKCSKFKQLIRKESEAPKPPEFVE